MTTQQAITLYNAIEALTKQFDYENGWYGNVMERTAQLAAHRACGNQEQDPASGKLAGYCVVCQVPWPCDIAKTQTVAEPADKNYVH